MATNGRLPASMLAAIPGTNRRLLKALIPQTAALRDAFERRFGKPLVITDAYRDYDEQVRLKIEKGPFAATPGTSNHGWARALDLGSRVNVEGSDEHDWMMANGPRYGWRNPLWARDNNPAGGQEEPWHWEASEIAVPVSNYTNAGGTVPHVPDLDLPDPLTPEDDIMASLDELRQVIAEQLGPTATRVRGIEVYLGAGGVLDLQGWAERHTLGGRVKDIQDALTASLPVLLADAAEPGADPAAIAAAVAAVIPAELAQDVIDALVTRLSA